MQHAAAALLALALAGPAAAQEPERIDPAATRACVEEALARGAAPTGCVEAAHAPCLAVPAETKMVASLCFETARQDWSGAIAARMATLRETAPEQIAALAGIEVKYDLLASLLQCDRLEELARLRETPAEDVLLQEARCAATAAGLAYIRLVARLPDPGTGQD
ncbi:hypothetical protein AVJ23_05940 [Pseudoponticoccus marisrubri]|uniref:Lysozyme inhibitor LprI N-terminal domain-containing protein n=2 Tax=Pseudoponticoccus marisrubri TaxID=1685382 RepID=A0A0W7WND7_9RHOB|nr:hypothetical protein AVJ23_05940 [Pseudoponticoccus marisrubri]